MWKKEWKRKTENTKTKWKEEHKHYHMRLRHSTWCRIYWHSPNPMLGSPQVLRVVLMAATIGTLRLMLKILGMALHWQAPAWAPSPSTMVQQGEEEVGGGDPTITFTQFNRLAHALKSGHGWEVTIESERRLRERNRATQTLPFKPISLNKSNSFTTLSYTFLFDRFSIINNSTPGAIYSPKTSALRK